MTSIDDHADFITVKKALSILGFSEEEAGVRREREDREEGGEGGREGGKGEEGEGEREEGKGREMEIERERDSPYPSFPAVTMAHCWFYHSPW